MDRHLTILQVSKSDMAGGAERSANNLFHTFKTLGHESWLAVGQKNGTHGDVLVLPNEKYRNSWVRKWSRYVEEYDSSDSRIRGLGRLMRAVRDLGEPGRWIHGQLGIEDFDHPATRHLLQLFPRKPDILHCHNLHGGYFDLRELPSLSAAVPTVLNVRDAWLMSGHCAFSLGCQKWTSGCGGCPDLSLYPAVKRDSTSYNWKRKKGILERSRVYLTTPSKWMLDMAERSILAPSIIDARVIPNGVDTDIFRPSGRSESRARLGLPADAAIMMTAGYRLRSNIWKDYEILREALVYIDASWKGRALLMLIVGDEEREERIGDVTVRTVPYQVNASDMASYYQASDLYLHAARVESFGNVLVEARACGTPVVSTAVGGIPEHVKSLAWNGLPDGIAGHDVGEANGMLTPPGDGKAMGRAVLELLDHPECRQALSTNGTRDIGRNFSVSRQAAMFLEWYEEILSTRTGNRRPH